jgi:hypothetical protein
VANDDVSGLQHRRVRTRVKTSKRRRVAVEWTEQAQCESHGVPIHPDAGRDGCDTRPSHRIKRGLERGGDVEVRRRLEAHPSAHQSGLRSVRPAATQPEHTHPVPLVVPTYEVPTAIAETETVWVNCSSATAMIDLDGAPLGECIQDDIEFIAELQERLGFSPVEPESERHTLGAPGIARVGDAHRHQQRVTLLGVEANRPLFAIGIVDVLDMKPERLQELLGRRERHVEGVLRLILVV